MIRTKIAKKLKRTKKMSNEQKTLHQKLIQYASCYHAGIVAKSDLHKLKDYQLFAMIHSIDREYLRTVEGIMY
jgi:hypothetical protein